ncbi:MAG: ADP-heptose--LPS heptosyltransferase [Pirellulaceae bacterium]|nr:MAG: ADP-heptose--LPS heptosyltransferase [Pirellulaceae bacterium]
MQRIGVLMPNWVGDAVMATPALSALRGFYRSAQIVGIMKPVIAELLAGSELFDHIVPYDPRNPNERYRFWAAVWTTRAWKLDQFFCFTNSLRASLFAALSGARQRWGWSGGVRRFLFCRGAVAVKRGTPREPVSAVDFYLSIVRTAGIDAERRPVFLATRPKDEVAADEALRRLGLDDRSLLVLNPGAAYGPAKMWPAEYFAALARRWVHQFPSNVLVLCGPNERDVAFQIERLAGDDRVRSLASFEPDLGRNKACLRRARLVISTDSGPRHIAAAFGVPTVVLFGPTDPRWSENYHPWQRVVSLKLPCQYCARRTCPLKHHRCMRNLTVEQVWPTAVELWHARQTSTRAS